MLRVPREGTPHAELLEGSTGHEKEWPISLERTAMPRQTFRGRQHDEIGSARCNDQDPHQNNGPPSYVGAKTALGKVDEKVDPSKEEYDARASMANKAVGHAKCAGIFGTRDR